MQIKPLTPENSAQYDDFLRSQKDGLFYHSSKYIFFLCKILNAQNITGVAYSGDKIYGIFPLLLKKGRFGNIINSMAYYGSHGSILTGNPSASSELKHYYEALLSKQKVQCSTLIENAFSKKPELFSNDSFTDFRIAQYTHLKFETSEDLMKSFHYKTRNMVRKAEKSGIRISEDKTALTFIKSIHNQNMNSIGGIAKSDLFFEQIPHFFTYGSDYKLYSAELNGERISGLLLFIFNGYVEYFTPVINPKYRNLQPLSLIIYTAMADLMNKYHTWNWGGTWESQEGVYRFKKRWGSCEKKYYYHTFLHNTDLLNCSKDELLSEYEGFYTVPFNKLN